ncbi:hypothetical protein [Microvirga flavescens]|uniref:hypothetical protein n=1 Tax=Microvirga flavescens TaxID=2249811 RepID=UPI000DD9680C|nr:hypothetical protein [Microvirga flavescens]
MTSRKFLKIAVLTAYLACPSSSALAEGLEFRAYKDQNIFWCVKEAVRLNNEDGGSFVSTMSPLFERVIPDPRDIEADGIYGIWVSHPDGSLTALICTKNLAFKIKNHTPAQSRFPDHARTYTELNTAGCIVRPFNSPNGSAQIAFENEQLQVSWISHIGGRTARSDSIQLCIGGFNRVRLL